MISLSLKHCKLLRARCRTPAPNTAGPICVWLSLAQGTREHHDALLSITYCKSFHVSMVSRGAELIQC